MSSITLTYKSGAQICGEFNVPASKSISNRVLILSALANSDAEVKNLAVCDDTDVMVKGLALVRQSSEKGANSSVETIDVGAAGTSMRFLTAFLSNTDGEWIITGTQRMKERPISLLVDALRSIGAEIEYMENDGFPPLRIHGHQLEGGSIDIDGSVSSQYISALMMIAPYTKRGLTINLLGNVASVPYILMTQSLMKTFGVDVEFNGKKIAVSTKKYEKLSYSVEGDWSGASYWYEICALNDVKSIRLSYLFKESLQGDSVVAEIFANLGVETRYESDGIVLTKVARKPIDVFEYDFIKCPDLAQAVVSACVGMNQNFKFSGLRSLKIKETDRIFALINEFSKLGYVLKETGEGELAWLGERTTRANDIVSIATYKDHRMAMCLAPLACRTSLVIEDYMVVTKSYPEYWNELKKTNVYSF